MIGSVGKWGLACENSIMNRAQLIMRYLISWCSADLSFTMWVDNSTNMVTDVQCYQRTVATDRTLWVLIMLSGYWCPYITFHLMDASWYPTVKALGEPGPFLSIMKGKDKYKQAKVVSEFSEGAACLSSFSDLQNPSCEVLSALAVLASANVWTLYLLVHHLRYDWSIASRNLPGAFIMCWQYNTRTCYVRITTTSVDLFVNESS